MPRRYHTRKKPKYIYLTELTKDGEFQEFRVNFHPQQYNQLVNTYSKFSNARAGYSVSCKRLDLETNEWERYPRPDTDTTTKETN